MNKQIELMRLFDKHEHSINLALPQDICEFFYHFHGGLEEEVNRLRERLVEYREEIDKVLDVQII